MSARGRRQQKGDNEITVIPFEKEVARSSIRCPSRILSGIFIENDVGTAARKNGCPGTNYLNALLHRL
jgi:hypothetical protein